MIPKLKTPEWTDTLNYAVDAAVKGREVLMHYWGRLEKIEKKFQAGLVSEADKESERAIFDSLRKNFPGDEMLGEESSADKGNPKMQPLKSDCKHGRWIVDPLDGTTNYIHKFPTFCISIGYEWQGQIQLAVIDAPVLGETFTAVRGHGAFLNGQPLKVSSTQTLEDSFLGSGFFNEIESNLEEQCVIFPKLVRQVRGVRCPGSAALDLCQVARGVFDGYWNKDLKPWDAAAGILIVEEAGGKVCTYRGQGYNPFKNSLVAGNSKIADQIVKEMQGLILPTTE